MTQHLVVVINLEVKNIDFKTEQKKNKQKPKKQNKKGDCGKLQMRSM